MSGIPHKKLSILLIALFALLSTVFVSCGDSQGVTSLAACLSEFTELVEDYKTTVGSDRSKQSEWDAKVAAISEKWTNIRNEFGSDITPQHMDKLVKQYEGLMLTLANFKKTVGSS